MKVYKYELPEPCDYFTLRMPKYAKILTLQNQHGKPCIWALVHESLPLVERKFRWAGTGHTITETDEELEYVGTFQMMSGDLIFHIFEVLY